MLPGLVAKEVIKDPGSFYLFVLSSLLHKLPPVLSHVTQSVTTGWIRHLHPGRDIKSPALSTPSSPSKAGGSIPCGEEPTQSDLLWGRFPILDTLRGSGRSQEKLGLNNGGGPGV